MYNNFEIFYSCILIMPIIIAGQWKYFEYTFSNHLPLPQPLVAQVAAFKVAPNHNINILQLMNSKLYKRVSGEKVNVKNICTIYNWKGILPFYPSYGFESRIVMVLNSKINALISHYFYGICVRFQLTWIIFKQICFSHSHSLRTSQSIMFVCLNGGLVSTHYRPPVWFMLPLTRFVTKSVTFLIKLPHAWSTGAGKGPIWKLWWSQ